MKANNLTISIPNMGCDKNCPYCVSKMTGYINANEKLIKRNLPKVERLAHNAGATSVLFTGKGEPLLNLKWVKNFTSQFKSLPLEIQTNGILIKKKFSKTKDKIIRELYDMHINTVAFSFDKIQQIEEYSEIFFRMKQYGMNVRVTFNISKKGNCDSYSFDQFLDMCKKSGINQISLRKLTIPEKITDNTESNAAADWIREHVNDELYDRWTRELKSYNPRVIRELPFGALIYDWGGLSISHFDYCIQERSKDDDIRSLIFQEDGHLYTSWDSEASILF